jgi:hypothetical protein
MAIPLEGRIGVRRDAPLHVQLRLTNKPEKIPEPSDEVSIHGYVVKVFRGENLASVGELITFRLWVVCRPGDIPTGPAYVYYDALMNARHLEAFLYGASPHCRLGAYEFKLMGEPTQEPTMTVEELERLM